MNAAERDPLLRGDTRRICIWTIGKQQLGNANLVLPVLGKPPGIIVENLEFGQYSSSNLMMMPVLIIVLESGHLKL